MNARPHNITLRRVVWWWYLVPILPIMAVGYGAQANPLPSWALLVVVVAFFMWLFSLLFAVLTRKVVKEPRQ